MAAVPSDFLSLSEVLLRDFARFIFSSSSWSRNGLYMGGAAGRNRLVQMTPPLSVRLEVTGGGSSIPSDGAVSSVAATSTVTSELPAPARSTRSRGGDVWWCFILHFFLVLKKSKSVLCDICPIDISWWNISMCNS